MTDSYSKRGNPCTFTGVIVEDKLVRNCNMTCKDKFISGCDFKIPSDITICERYELTTNKKGQSDLLPLFDTVTGLGSLWEVTGPYNWRGVWRRREGSDTFDGEWYKGNASVRTVVQVERSADKFKATRIKSSDGYLCIYEGNVKGTTVEGTQRCAASNQNYQSPVPFRAVIHP